MANKKQIFAVSMSLLLGSAAALAQTSPIRPAYSFPGTMSSEMGPASAQIGDSPVYITPWLGTAFGHDDNLFLSDTFKKASYLYIVSPGFRFDARSSNMVFVSSYQAQLGVYTSSTQDNYQDQVWHNQLDVAFDQRNFLRLGLDYVHGHDPRGSTDRPVSSRPDKWYSVAPSATYAYGAPGARGRLELYASDTPRRYLNNRDFTVASDRDTQEYGGALYFRVAPRTSILGEFRRTEIDYTSPSVIFDSTEDRYYAGVTWEATAATAGTIKVGRLKKTFDNPTLADFTGTGWEGMVTWAPRTYSKLDVYSSRAPSESTGLGTFIMTETLGAVWTHNWSSVITSQVSARYQEDKYHGFDRTDKTDSLGLKVGYRLRRWLTLGAEYQWSKRDSNLDQFDYTKNLWLLTATGTL